MKRENKEIKGARVICPAIAVSGLVIALFFLFINCANAEVATIQKPLIFSADNSGDYKLSRNTEGVYSPDDFIATSGQIKSLTVNWQADGKINFEVSADNGLHYYSVVNGVPLKSGFVSGNRLRWRATVLSDDVKLSLAKINYTDSSGVEKDFGEPTLSGFLYRKEIQIKKSANQDLYNYQLKLKIAESAAVKNVDVNLGQAVLADFKDIRFSAADGQTPLPYYRESVEGEAGSRVATVWVKVPEIPKEGVILYLYYGNAGAEDQSSPNATFDFYEDFQAGSLDKNKWVVHTEQKGSAQLTKGMIKLDAAEIITKEFQFKEGIIEYSSSAESGFESSLNIRNKNEESYDSPIWLAYSSIYKGAEHCIAVDGIVKANDATAKLTTAGENYNYRINLNNGKLTFERFDAANAEKQASVTYDINPMPKAGYLSLRSGGDGGGKNIIYFGTLRARKSSANLPVIENVGKEERVSLPVFVDTTISKSGGLTLKDEATSGYYLAQDLTAAVESPVRIIVPSWKIEASDMTTIGVNVSADKGVTYKKNCENAKFYYASKKDFAEGTNLKVRFDLQGSVIANPPKAGKAISGGISMFALDYRPGKINVISPNGKEQWGVGEKQKISWSAQDYEPSYLFDLDYSLDQGKSYISIATQEKNDGVYSWTIPDAVSKTVKVKVSDSLDKDIYDTSDASFSVAANTSAEETTLEEATLEEAQKATSGAQLLVIKGKSLRQGRNKIGDIVGIFDSNHEFSAAEKASFDIIRVPGKTKEQVEKALARKVSASSAATPGASNSKYKFRVVNPKELNPDTMCVANEGLK